MLFIYVRDSILKLDTAHSNNKLINFCFNEQRTPQRELLAVNALHM